MAHGTAVAAFDASSLIWTLESNEPGYTTNAINASSPRESGKNSQIVHSGAKKLKMNAYPAGHPLRFVKFPRAKLASFMNSFGVAAGRAMITARHNLRGTDQSLIGRKRGVIFRCSQNVQNDVEGL